MSPSDSLSDRGGSAALGLVTEIDGSSIASGHPFAVGAIVGRSRQGARIAYVEVGAASDDRRVGFGAPRE